MEKKLAEMIAAREAKKAELVERSKKSEDVNELRSINSEIDDINGQRVRRLSQTSRRRSVLRNSFRARALRSAALPSSAAKLIPRHAWRSSVKTSKSAVPSRWLRATSSFRVRMRRTSSRASSKSRI